METIPPEAPSAATVNAPRRLPAGVREVSLVVLGAALALAAEEWRDSRAERRRSTVAVASIRAELVENRARVERAREHHVSIADTLDAFLARRQLPPEAVYYSGVFLPALPLSTAWQAAREMGVLASLPYPLVLALAPVYEAQVRYRELSDALSQATMIDVQRRGALPVFRDDFSHFIPIERDFANREKVLAASYERTIASLDSLQKISAR